MNVWAEGVLMVAFTKSTWDLHGPLTRTRKGDCLGYGRMSQPSFTILADFPQHAHDTLNLV